MKVGIINYGAGNIGSISRAIRRMGSTPALISSPNDIFGQDRLILPGVGSFGDCAKLLDMGGWRESIHIAVFEKKIPLLGICVGMQLLGSYGAEGAVNTTSESLGLGLIPGSVLHLGDLGCNLRLPHTGWNALEKISVDTTILQSIPLGTDFYFVHSYGFVPDDANVVMATVKYGIYFWRSIPPRKKFKSGFYDIKKFHRQ